MAPELTRGLLESVEYAAQHMTTQAKTLRDSHHCEAGWDSDEIHAEHKACLQHAWRLECFARSLAVVLRRGERERERIQQN